MVASDLRETRVLVEGLNCSGCVATLTRKGLGIYGVVHVDVELDPGRESLVTLRHASAVDGERLCEALMEYGYRVRFPVSA